MRILSIIGLVLAVFALAGWAARIRGDRYWLDWLKFVLLGLSLLAGIVLFIIGILRF